MRGFDRSTVLSNGLEKYKTPYIQEMCFLFHSSTEGSLTLYFIYVLVIVEFTVIKIIWIIIMKHLHMIIG